MVKKITKELAINKLKELNYIIVNEDKFLQNENATTNLRTNIKCLTHDYIWEATIGEVYRQAKICKECRNGREFIRRQKNKSFCVYCDGKKVDYEYLVELLYDINMKAVSKEYVDSGKTPFTIACNKCDTEFTSVWDNLKQRQVKNGCNNCNKIKEINEKLKKIEYEFVDLIYIDAKTNNNYTCPNGHIVNKCRNTIKVQKNKCKECAK